MTSETIKTFLRPWIRPIGIRELKAAINSRPRPRPNELRSRVRILVIDDKEFTPLPNLQRLNFDIMHWEDINSIDTVSPYNIVLTDIDGVGRSINPQQQGVGIIREIRGNFPDKYVIAYSGKGNSDLTEQANQISDDFLKKDATTDQWCSSLDRGVRAVSDPIFAWQRTCEELVRLHVPTYDISLIEELYVKKLMGDAQSDKLNVDAIARDLNLNQDVRAVVQNLISSSVFELAKSLIEK